MHEVVNNNVKTKKDCINKLVMVAANSNERRFVNLWPWNSNKMKKPIGIYNYSLHRVPNKLIHILINDVHG